MGRGACWSHCSSAGAFERRRIACRCEQQVRAAVDERSHLLVDGLLGGERHDPALGAAHDRAGDVQARGGLAARLEHEMVEVAGALLEHVDRVLEKRHVGDVDVRRVGGGVSRWHRHRTRAVEEALLDEVQHVVEGAIGHS